MAQEPSLVPTKSPLLPSDWYKTAVIYQIYPYSFLDTTGTGIGDISGITQRLPYIRSIGVDVIWLSPIYASPMKDMGYDISDYKAIHPDMGTMADWEKMVDEAHKLGLKVVMDLVVNHTSDQHEWFQKSRKKEDGMEDWYMWHQGRINQEGKREEPNNWGAIFGGSTWEWDEDRSEYYLHVFDVSQPDLNWESPNLRNAVWDVMRFWLEKGCDGFRMDVINCISKETGFPDVPVTDPSSKFQYGLQYRFNGPHVLTYLSEMHQEVLRHYPDAFLVGETPGIQTAEQGLPYVQGGKPLQMYFHFEHMYIDHQPGMKCFYHRDWKLTELKKILGDNFMKYNEEHDGWDSLYLENHDQPRILGRWANDKQFRTESAKMLALFHATGRGTLFLYQGQELGMANPSTWTYNELKDLEEINWYNEVKDQRTPGADMTDCLEAIQFVGRDNARTPMQWNASENAGFTKGKPWIKVNPDYPQWNAEAEEKDEGSVLNFWRKLLEIRKDNVELVTGMFEMVDRENEEVYCYTRGEGEKGRGFLVVCSFEEKDVELFCPIETGEFLLGNYDVDNQPAGSTMRLRPYECRLYKVAVQ